MHTYTGPRQGQEPGSIVSYCASAILSTETSSVPVQCESHYFEFMLGGGGEWGTGKVVNDVGFASSAGG